MGKRWRWVIVGMVMMGLAALALVASNGYQNDRVHITKNGIRINYFGDVAIQARSFTDKELEAANQALATGIHISDPQNDWYITDVEKEHDGRPNNKKPYSWPWTDYKRVSMGADQKYLYVKYQFWGTFPPQVARVGDDFQIGTGASIESLTFMNTQGQKDTADLNSVVWYADGNNTFIPAEKPVLMHRASLSPTGYDKDSETIFTTTTSAGMIEGGPSYDYLLSAYPLSLFNLKLGDEVTFHSSTETSSKTYHHEAWDNLLDKPGSKFGHSVKYILGSNKYELVDIEPKNFSRVETWHTSG